MATNNLQNNEPVQNDMDVDTNKSDAVDFTTVIRGVHVNMDGVIRGILNQSSTARDYTVKSGMYYPYCFKRIYNTGTTSLGAIGLY